MFYLIFSTFSLSFFSEMKLYMKSSRLAGISLDTFILRILSSAFLYFCYQAEAFNGCYEKLCKIKWFDFCMSITLRVIFKWLVNGGRWIITGGR